MEKSDFGKKLVEVRKIQGLTQEEVAEKCKITVRTIQRIESGSVEPRVFTIKLISKTFGFDFFDNANTSHTVVKKENNSNFGIQVILWYIKDLFNLKTNTMKKVSILTTVCLAIGFLLFIFGFGVKAQSSKEQVSMAKSESRQNYVKTKDRIEVAFTNELTFDSLVFIKQDLQTRGITINYRLIEFDGKNQLESINCNVECNDGYKGGFSIGYLSSENKNKRIGFYRDYSDKSKSTFGTGSLER